MRIKLKELKVLWIYSLQADIHQRTVKENTVEQRNNEMTINDFWIKQKSAFKINFPRLRAGNLI